MGERSEMNRSSFSTRLQSAVRILELPGKYVWCASPIEDDRGKTHVFFSQWDASKGMGGWISCCEIGHAVADQPEGPYVIHDIALTPREGMWDSTSVHNPHIQKIDGQYVLFFMGNCNKKTDTKRVGIAVSDSLDGPWKRSDSPIIQPGDEGAWDDHCTTNPCFLKRDGKYWIYYKSWNTNEYVTSTHPTIRGNRKYGLAISDKLEGPYHKHPDNPIIDFSSRGNNCQFEDAFVWQEDDKIKLIARDMGFFDHEKGLYFESDDGVHFSDPTIAYYGLNNYIQQPAAPAHLKRYGRIERPQLLLRNGKPAYLFGASQGGKYETSSAVVLKIMPT